MKDMNQLNNKIKSKIYINEKNISLEQALKIMTDEWVDEGNYCAQTVIDMRDALKKCLKEIKSLKKSKASTIKLMPTTGPTHNIMTDETVTISKEEYESLLEDRKWLQALEGAGVDNWEGYDFAREIYNEDT